MYARDGEHRQLIPDTTPLAGNHFSSNALYVDLDVGGAKADDTPNSAQRIEQLLLIGDSDLLMQWFSIAKDQLIASPSCCLNKTIRVAVPRSDDKNHIVYGFMSLCRLEDGKLCGAYAEAHDVPPIDLSFTDEAGELVKAPERYAV